MQIRAGYGLALTAGEDAAAAYNRGIDRVLRMRSGAVDSVAMAITLDPTAEPAQVVFAASTADIHTVLIDGRRIV